MSTHTKHKAAGTAPDTVSDTAPGTVKKLRAACSAHTALGTHSTVRGHALVFDQPQAAGGHDAGASPMETVLAAVAACAQVVFHRTATEFGLAPGQFYAYALAEQDSRGQAGHPEVQSYFTSADLHFSIALPQAAASENQLAELVAQVHRRCPGLNLLADARVRLRCCWDFAPAPTATDAEYFLHQRLGIPPRVAAPPSGGQPHTRILCPTTELLEVSAP